MEYKGTCFYTRSAFSKMTSISTEIINCLDLCSNHSCHQFQRKQYTVQKLSTFTHLIKQLYKKIQIHGQLF